MKRVVSVSLGSSSRDKTTFIQMDGEEFLISRVGTDGSLELFANYLKRYDGKVDAIGLGGIDRYLYSKKRRYTVREAEKLAKSVQKTPVVDGSGVKNTLERRAILQLQGAGVIDFRYRKTLVVSGVDRFGMAQALAEIRGEVVFGDLVFSLGIPLPIKSYSALCTIADLLLPIVCRLPFKVLYPTGEKQENHFKGKEKYFLAADIVAGDWHYIRRYMPERMEKKIIITNTVTEEDRAHLKSAGVSSLITTTPCFDGRNFGTNVLEGIITALTGKMPDEITSWDYEKVFDRLGLLPIVETF